MSSLILGVLFSIILFFFTFSLRKNENLAANRWLAINAYGNWLFCVWLCFINFIRYANHVGVLKVIPEFIRQPIVEVVPMVMFFSFSMYLFSLRKMCMQYHMLPKTIKVFIRRKWHYIIYPRYAKGKRKAKCYYQLDKIIFK